MTPRRQFCIEYLVLDLVCGPCTGKLMSHLPSVAFVRIVCVGLRGALILLGRFVLRAMFGDDEDGLFSEDEFDAEEESARLCEEAEAEAAALGLLGDMHSEIPLPVAASSASSALTDGPVTPPRNHHLPVMDLSMEKRVAPDQREEICERKRLRFKQPVPVQPTSMVPRSILIDGKPIKNHPLYVRYFKMDPAFRRLASKRMSQQKYRLVNTLVNEKSVEIYGKTVNYGGEQSEAATQVDYLFFLGVAKDETKSAADRGYALSQLAVYERDIDLGCSDSNKTLTIKNVPSALLTYIGDFGLLDINSVLLPSSSIAQSIRGLGAEEKFRILRSMHVDAVAELLKSHSQVAKFLSELQTQAINTSNKVHSPQWAVTVEVCGKSLAESDVLRIHGHLWVMLKGQSLEVASIAIDEGRCAPYANWAALRFLSGMSARSAASAMAGAFYCTVVKKGTIRQLSTCQPWVDFAVRDAWITSMYAADKLVFSVAREAYVRTVHRAAQNVQQLEFCHRERQKTGLRERMRRIEGELREQFLPWRVIPDVTIWDAQYAEMLGRYKFLVLDGDSWFGKTKFALSLQPLGTTYYRDCTSGIPDLRDFDGDRFSAILFDELSAKEGIKLKKCLQASNEPVVMGVSPTMMSAYTVHVYRTRIIVCTNLWAGGVRNLNKLDRDWMNKNSVYIAVKEPLWVVPKKGLPVLQCMPCIRYVPNLTCSLCRQRLLHPWALQGWNGHGVLATRKNRTPG